MIAKVAKPARLIQRPKLRFLNTSNAIPASAAANPARQMKMPSGLSTVKRFMATELVWPITVASFTTQGKNMKTIKVAYAAFLQAFYVGEDSQACADKIKNAYDQSVASAEPAVMIKDGDLALE